MPAELYLGSCKLHLDKRKGNISFSKANIINAKKYRCQKDERDRKTGKSRTDREWTLQVS